MVCINLEVFQDSWICLGRRVTSMMGDEKEEYQACDVGDGVDPIMVFYITGDPEDLPVYMENATGLDRDIWAVLFKETRGDIEERCVEFAESTRARLVLIGVYV